MAAVSSPPLTSEPTNPIEREYQNLPPKTYTDAVESGLSVGDENAPNGVAEVNEINGIKPLNGNGINGTSEGGDTPSVLSIVNEGTSKEERQEEGSENRKTTEVYSTIGLDDRPRTPVKNRNERSASKISNGSNDNIENSSKKGNKKNNSLDQKSKVKNIDDKNRTTVFEQANGDQIGELISVKPDGRYEKEKRHDKKVSSKSKTNGGITSGRKAGQRWEKSAIRWAPLNVPLQRRLQTLVVLCHTLCIAICVSFFFFLCAIPLFWPLLIPYMIYTMTSKASTSGTLSHRLEFLRSSSVWSLFASYFPARLHRSQELPPTRKYIFGYHPHGIISMGAFGAFATEALGFSQLFPGIKNTLLTLDSNFRIPIYRDYALAMGISSVSRESCENLLSKGGSNKEGMGRAITIVIGGARESLDAQPHSLRLVLKCRKGFVKLAIRTGADLVPVLAFGENDLFDQLEPEEYPKIHKFQLLVKKLLGFTIPLFHARGIFNYDVGLMPYRRPLNIVVGRPVKVIQNPKPEQEEIDRVHEEYVQELERIWNTWKDDFSPDRKEELQFVE